MAKFKSLILTSVLVLCCCSIYGQTSHEKVSNHLEKDFPKQESKNRLIFSGSFMHFQEKQGNAIAGDVSNIRGYYLFPLNPGLGIFYQYQIFQENYLLIGANYRTCYISSNKNDILRFRYREPSFSIGYKKYFLKREKIGLYSSISLSYGQTKLSDSEHYGHIKWVYLNPKEVMGYSNNYSFADIVFNAGILFPSSQIEIAPEVGYRLKDNWMGFYRHRFFYGLSINYQLKFSKK
ncbi:MAG: hypothetical protein WCI54_14480 [Bacteroidia bacterium]